MNGNRERSKNVPGHCHSQRRARLELPQLRLRPICNILGLGYRMHAESCSAPVDVSDPTFFRNPVFWPCTFSF